MNKQILLLVGKMLAGSEAGGLERGTEEQAPRVDSRVEL